MAAHALGTDITTPQTLAHGYATALQQPMRTGAMPVNPYLAFRPLPAACTLAPMVDRWSDITTTWTSPVTNRLYTGSGSQSYRPAGQTDVTRTFIRHVALAHLVPPLRACALCRHGMQGHDEGLLCACPAVRGVQPVRLARAVGAECGPDARHMDMDAWRLR